MRSTLSNVLDIEELTREAFAPFGDVIGADAATQKFLINGGTAERFHALGDVECVEGRAIISIVRAQPRRLPFEIRMLERHPLGSQAFIPQAMAAYLVVVAASPTHRPRAFLATGGVGVNFHRGCWHHPLLALESVSDFIVVDRIGEGNNCDEVELAEPYELDSVSL